MTRGPLVVVLVISAGLGGAAAVQTRLDGIREARGENELLYLPNEKLLDHFTFGQHSLIASALWLRCIQYTTKEFNRDKKYTWLEHMANTIARLDPYFIDAYKYGAMFLSTIKGDERASLDLLHTGIANNPDSWELMYEAAMVYLLNRRDEPRSKEMAARYLAMATATGKAPGFVLETAQALSRMSALYDVERALWRDVLDSGDAMMRDVAQLELALVDLREASDQLTRAMREHKERTGKNATSFQELLDSGLISSAPSDPLGGRFFVDERGLVKNTSVLDRDLEKRRSRLRHALDRYHERQGRWPDSLESLADSEFLAAVPLHPYADQGGAWRYSPESGALK